MSLIHEALKRSESDKNRYRSPYFDNLTVIPPDGDDEVPPPPRPGCSVSETPGPPRKTRGLMLALLTLLVLAGAFFLLRSSGSTGPDSAVADATDQPPRPLTPGQMIADANRAAPDPTLNHHNTDGQADANIASAGKGSDPGKLRIRGGSQADAFTDAMRKLRQAWRTRDGGDANDKAPGKPTLPSGSEPLTSGGKPIQWRRPPAPTFISDRGDPSPKPSATDKTAAGTTDKTGGDENPDAAKQPTSAPAKPADPDAEFIATLRVTAILRGSSGNVALINGGLYRVGQTIQGAKITRIGQYEVEVTYKGKTHTIRI